MNRTLLESVRHRIIMHPQSLRMGAYITEIGEKTCGCIAMMTIAEGEKTTLEHLSDMVDHTPMGNEAQRAAELLEINAEQGRLLFHLNMWPLEFRILYKRDKAKAAEKRIQHFILTNGVE